MATINGTSGPDNLNGTAGNDVINGLDGNDTIDGKGGFDTLNGGAGDDVIRQQQTDAGGIFEGGAGADTIFGYQFASSTASYAHSAAGVSVDLLAHTASGGDAQGDVLTGISGLIGSAFDDVLKAGGVGFANTDVLQGGAGNDTLVLTSRGGLMEGGAGADTLIGNSERPDLTYIASYEHSAAAVTVNLATGHGSGGDAEGDVLQFVNQVQGSAHDDVLVGAATAEFLSGGDGDDHLYGSAGADTLDGGAGQDTVDYSQSARLVSVDLTSHTGTGGDAQGDQISDVENIVGSNFNDTLGRRFRDQSARRRRRQRSSGRARRRRHRHLCAFDRRRDRQPHHRRGPRRGGPG